MNVNSDPDWFQITNADAIPSPALLVYPARIEENLRRMIQRAGGPERLRPHVKTHKMPQVVKLKLSAGITRFKCSTIAEAEMTASAGGKDILLAYPPVGPTAQRLAELARRFPDVAFSTIADSSSTVLGVYAAAKAAGVCIGVYVDLNVGMNRTGISPGPAAVALYELVVEYSRSNGPPIIRAAGLHAYDGHLHNKVSAALATAVNDTFAAVWQMKAELERAGLTVPCIIASGTPTFPLLAEHASVEVGCGTTVLWDFGQAEICPDMDFLNAAVLLMRVVSKPTADRLCLDLGHKAVASEMPHPRVRVFGLEDAIFVTHSEEHLVVQTPRAIEYEVGDVLYGIPRHVCPTVALHHEVWAIKDGAAVEPWTVVARARRISI